MAHLEKLRPCGRLETYSTIRHHLGLYHNAGVTATYTTSKSPPNSLEPLVLQALREVVTKHSILSTTFINESKSYPSTYFARLTQLDLRSCVEFTERLTPFPDDGEADEELDAILTKQHSQDFKTDPEKNPSWRVVVLRWPATPTTISVSWIFHHALADGMSALLFHETFLVALNSVAAEEDPSPNIDCISHAFIPHPLEELHPLPITWSFLLLAILGDIVPSVFDKRPTRLWTGNPVPQIIQPIPQSYQRTLAFSTEKTRELARLSHREKASVTATLQCLLAVSLFANLPADQYDKIKIECFVSMRRFLSPNTEGQITNAITMCDYLHHRPVVSRDENGMYSGLLGFSWDDARAVKSVIQAEVYKEGRDNAIALLKYVSNMTEFFVKKLGKPRPSTCELSNLGVHKPKDTPAGSWTTGRMTFSQSPDLTACALGVNVVTGGDGNATVNFCWMEGAIDGEMVENVIKGVRTGVDCLLESDRLLR